MTSTTMIDVRGFKKTFFTGLRRKPSLAVKDITFQVERGEIFGFLGPNGAGKTTTIKAMLGLIRASAGTLKLCGFPCTSLEWRHKVGYLPEHPNFYDYLTGLELVAWFGQLAGLSRVEAEARARKLLQRVGLSAALGRRLRGYSKGMLQRAGLAQALIGSPDLLILDEPMTGLDPIGRRDIRELLLELKHEGKTIFYSTHILPDVEMTCDRVAIIDKGTVRRSGALDEILKETTKGISVTVSKLTRQDAGAWVPSTATIVETGAALQIEFAEPEAARAFAKNAINHGAQLEKFEPHRDDLESIFLRSLGGDLDAVRAENR